jgi:hypothetical protein
MEPEKIALIFDLFKWLMYGIGTFLIFAIRYLWKISRDISDLKTHTLVSGVEFNNLKKSHEELKSDHHDLKEFVYSKN